MTAQFARTPYRARSGGSSIAEPHAALLIDFDNVTMGIRSDLTKELKSLLNSDIIKGKVAVQRAYADWRRYPQYIVPLAESSVDLIYAPAYGSAKKNATDIRLAIDALELVFTRPEIGTFILLSGDSDFSSLVLKLKEYGKYVIGVGIRESASDLLVQNCDEYYSYSALTGLTRAGEESPVVSEDPWELVDLAIRQMTDKSDVMRSDRLKQVLLEMDPGFDEKSLGFQKFNKFLQEAATRGILALRKLENGQFEVELPSGDSAPAAAVEPATESKEGRRGRGRRGRGRREDVRSAAEPAVPEVAAEAPTELTEPELRPAEPTAAVPASLEPEPVSEVIPVQPGAARGAELDLRASYELLQRAVADLVRKNGAAVRDSDVKRRMLELAAGWDESALGFSKFSRFLRQAHDAEIITLRRIDGGNYEIVPGEGAKVRIDPEPAEPSAAGAPREGRARSRGRRGGRERPEPAESPAAELVVEEPAARVEAPARTPEAPARTTETPARTTETPARTIPAPAAAAAPATGKAPAAPLASAIGFRRGSRGRAAPVGPPPLLEGQAARIAQPGAAQTSAPAATAAEGAAEQPSRPRERTRGARKEKAPTKRDRTPSATPARSTEQRKAGGALDAVSLGLPREAGEIANYIVTNYRGVGPRSVQTLIERFGATRVWDVLETKPDEVRAVIGAGRGDRLLEAYRDDVSARRANAAPPEGGPARAGKRATGSGRARSSRGRRGRTTGP